MPPSTSGAALTSLRLALAAPSAGCSVLFGGDRYVGGSGEDDARASDLDASDLDASDLDARRQDDNAVSPVEPDAYLVDAYEGPDAVTPCSDATSCAVDEFCDPTRRVCRPCDGDGDGILARECPRDDLRFFDCDPDRASPVSSMLLPDGFQDTLRVFREGGETFVFFRDPRSVNTFHVGVDTEPRDLTYGSIRVDEIDAVRTPNGVVIAGVHRDGFVQYLLGPAGPEERGTRLYADLYAFGSTSVASAVPAIISANVTGTSVDALVEVQKITRTGSPSARAVVGIGSGHEATTFGSSGSPDERVAASANGIAVVPGYGTAGLRRSVLVTTDVRPWGKGNVGRVDLPTFSMLDEPFGQVAIAAGPPTDEFGRIGVVAHSGPARGTFTAYVISCVMSPLSLCERRGSEVYALPGLDPGIALASFPGSSSRSVLFAATESQFQIHLLETLPPIVMVPVLPSPAPAPMFSMPVPPLTGSPTELAMDLTADLSADPPVLTFTLARASGSRIQTVTTDVCVDATATP